MPPTAVRVNCASCFNLKKETEWLVKQNTGRMKKSDQNPNSWSELAKIGISDKVQRWQQSELPCEREHVRVTAKTKDGTWSKASPNLSNNAVCVFEFSGQQNSSKNNIGMVSVRSKQREVNYLCFS